MRIFVPAIPLCLAVTAMPAAAEVTYHVQGRFGVAYTSDQSGGSQVRPLYEGSVTTSFSHELDTGIRFRFDVGVVVSNYDTPALVPRPSRPGGN